MLNLKLKLEKREIKNLDKCKMCKKKTKAKRLVLKLKFCFSRKNIETLELCNRSNYNVNKILI